MKLDKICRDANIMLVFARSYGLTGLVRISVKVTIMLMVFAFLLYIVVVFGNVSSSMIVHIIDLN